MPSRQFRVPPHLLLSLAVLFWAGNLVLGRAVGPDIPPIALNFWRWTGGGLILLPFTARALWRHRAIIGRHWRTVGALAITGITAFHSFVYVALKSTTAINSSLFMAATPVLIPIFIYGLDRTHLSLRQWAGISLSMIGVVTIITRADWAVISALDFNAGDLWMMMAVPLWALYSVILKRHPVPLPQQVSVLAIITFAVILLIPVYGWELAFIGGFELNIANLASVGYLALFAAAIGYVFWNRGVAALGAAKAGLFMHLIPVFTVLLAVILLGEAFEVFHVFGIALIITGLILTTRTPSAAGRSGTAGDTP
ncbi:MAG: DMT family transporter [Alphaproteobacteria bacterium]